MAAIPHQALAGAPTRAFFDKTWKPDDIVKVK
jgi:hypothetical protein